VGVGLTVPPDRPGLAKIKHFCGVGLVPPNLGREIKRFSRDVFEGFATDCLGLAVAVPRGCVNVVDSSLEGIVDDLLGLGLGLTVLRQCGYSAVGLGLTVLLQCCTHLDSLGVIGLTEYAPKGRRPESETRDLRERRERFIGLETPYRV